MINENSETENEEMSFEQAISMAIEFHQNGRISESEALYKCIWETVPERPEAPHFLGLISFQKGDTDQAIELLEASLKLHPEYTDARNNLGNIYRTIRNYPAAEAAYRKTVEDSPLHAEAWNNLGGVLSTQKKYSEALECYNKAAEQAPDNADFHFNRGHALHNTTQWEEAESAFLKAIHLEPKHAAAYRELGTVQQALGRPEDAEKNIKQSAEIDSAHGEAHCAHGLALERLYLLPDALLAYQRSIDRDPTYFRSYRQAAMVLQKLQRHAEAADMFAAWLRLDPDDATAKHMFEASNADSQLTRASDDYIEEHFDQFAKGFDTKLATLDYKAPELLCTLALEKKIIGPKSNIDILDAGCGTGLCGPLLKPYADLLVGVDLSQGMLDEAGERGNYYTELVHAEITSYLQQSSRKYDLIISADTLVYFGDLSEVISASSASLNNNGWLLFSVENLDKEDSKEQYHLNTHGRFSHSREYLHQTMNDCGLQVDSITEVVLRQELNKPVHGYLVLGQKIS